jgi:hypothetical protein
VESLQTEPNEEKGESLERVSLHNSHDPAVSRCICRCAELFFLHCKAAIVMIGAYSHPARTEHRSAWDPTSTCCYPRRGRQWQRSNCPDSRLRPDDGFKCCSSCCGSRRRNRRRRSHPIPNDADVLSGDLRLLYFSQSAGSHGSCYPPSLSSLPSSPPPSPR